MQISTHTVTLNKQSPCGEDNVPSRCEGWLLSISVDIHLRYETRSPGEDNSPSRREGGLLSISLHIQSPSLNTVPEGQTTYHLDVRECNCPYQYTYSLPH